MGGVCGRLEIWDTAIDYTLATLDIWAPPWGILGGVLVFRDVQMELFEVPMGVFCVPKRLRGPLWRPSQANQLRKPEQHLIIIDDNS